MKKLLNSLPFRLLAGVIIGILVGLVANETFISGTSGTGYQFYNLGIKI